MAKFLRTPFAIALLFGLLCGLTEATEPLNHMYWNIRFKMVQQAAPGSVVVLTEASEADGGQGRTWTLDDQARLLDIVSRQMPQNVFFDVPLDIANDRQGAERLRQQVARFGGDIAFVMREDQSSIGSKPHFQPPPPQLTGRAEVLFSAWRTNFIGYAVEAPARLTVDGRTYRHFASRLGDREGALEPTSSGSVLAAPEYDTSSISRSDARHVLANDFAPGSLTGRTVVISREAQPGQLVGYFGHGRIDPVLVDVTAGLGQRRPFAMSLGWLPLLALAALLIGLAQRLHRTRYRLAVYTMLGLATLVLPIPLELIGLTTLPNAALSMMAMYGGVRLWRRWRDRVRHTNASGLPNLLSMSQGPIAAGHDVVVAVIARYEEFLATLPGELHGECAQQVARRLAVGVGGVVVCQGDGGQFGWLEEARPLESQLEHLDGLRALFGAPLQVGGFRFDTNIHFGLDRNAGLDASSRVNSALASATEALKNGRTAEVFEEGRLANASWDLSLHARIDEGMRNGEIWMAYQPKWDFRACKLTGAEALIRWNHPERGPVRPDEFILQAERAGRIDTLTYWVLEQAISAHAALADLDPTFELSINLSGQMLDKPSLVPSFAEIAHRRQIDCRKLTVEVTETAGVQNRPAAQANLSALRAMGFRLSIDDFGTGEASLSYLAELPSDELKLDRRFVAAITGDDRNRKIVEHTIRLAHDLGQVVVAEGIEDAATFALLRKLNCDYGQGFFISRPMPLAELVTHCAISGPAGDNAKLAQL